MDRETFVIINQKDVLKGKRVFSTKLIFKIKNNTDGVLLNIRLESSFVDLNNNTVRTLIRYSFKSTVELLRG